MNQKSNIFWYRRDLRLDDNLGLFRALSASGPLRFIFIFDTNIINQFDPTDLRFSFIYNRLVELDQELHQHGLELETYEGAPRSVFEQLLSTTNIDTVFANEDFEPYSKQRDNEIKQLLKSKGSELRLFTDHVIFHPSTLLKSDNSPYTVFTPFSRRWLAQYLAHPVQPYPSLEKIAERKSQPKLHAIAISAPIKLLITNKTLEAKYPAIEQIVNYEKIRNLPHLDATTKVSTALRFGFISIRKLVMLAQKHSAVYLNELIWREFYHYILYHFPQTVNKSFKQKFDNIPWNLNEKDFQRWCNGETGYPLVDAGMRQLNSTGYMHNRIRMVVASFLTKHLLIDWRWGEAYFAQKLHDFEQSSNVGNWQWAASTGNDAAPYFRIFNPELQTKRFDPQHLYIKQWIPEFNTGKYPPKMIDHNFARNRALEVYSKASKESN